MGTVWKYLKCGFIQIVKYSRCFSLQACIYFFHEYYYILYDHFMKTSQGPVLDQTEQFEPGQSSR